MATKKENAVTSEKIRIRLKAYDHVVLEQSAEKIVDTAKRQELKFQVLFHYQQKRRLLQSYVLHTNTKIQENNLK